MIEESITLQEALEIAHKAGKKITLPTLITWVTINKLGHQPAGKNGKWYIFKKEFIEFINGGHGNAESPESECSKDSKASGSEKQKSSRGNKAPKKG